MCGPGGAWGYCCDITPDVLEKDNDDHWATEWIYRQSTSSDKGDGFQIATFYQVLWYVFHQLKDRMPIVDKFFYHLSATWAFDAVRLGYTGKGPVKRKPVFPGVFDSPLFILPPPPPPPAPAAPQADSIASRVSLRRTRKQLHF